MQIITLQPLPDMQTIPRKSRILASELLFDPTVWDNTKSEFGLIKLIAGSIKKTEMIDKIFKESLVENIVLSGGTSMMEGFPERVKNNLNGYKDEDFDNDEDDTNDEDDDKQEDDK